MWRSRHAVHHSEARIMLAPARLSRSLFLALGLATSACTTWRPQPLPQAGTIESLGPRPVRLTRVDSSHVVLRHAYVVRDSIAGRTGSADVSVALADIQ